MKQQKKCSFCFSNQKSLVVQTTTRKKTRSNLSLVLFLTSFFPFIMVAPHQLASVVRLTAQPQVSRIGKEERQKRELVSNCGMLLG